MQVDFGAPVRVDAYAPAPEAQALLFDTGELPYGEHTVTLTVAGEKNPASTGVWIEYDKVDKIRGMDIVITTTARTDEENRER